MSVFNATNITKIIGIGMDVRNFYYICVQKIERYYELISLLRFTISNKWRF